MRTCPRCGETKPVDEFWRDRRTKSGYAVYRKTCGRQRNAAKYRARAASEGRETKPWRHSGRICRRVSFGVSAASRSSLCLICMQAAAVHVDHDHTTGAIRGMLCFNCNGGLGQFKDDAEIAERAARYLRGEIVPPYLPWPDRRGT